MAPPPADDNYERQLFESPNGEWTLHFFAPYEFAPMAGDLFHVLLFAPNDVVENLPEGNPPHALQPWSADSRSFAYTTFTPRRNRSSLVMRTVDGTEIDPPLFSDYLVRAQWAPDRDRLLAVERIRVTLLSGDGAVVGFDDLGGVEDEWPITGWVPSGTYFFTLKRPSRDAPSQLRFYRAEDGKLDGAGELDPAELVPYDAQPYAKLRRDTWSLEVDAGTHGIGSMLDYWHDARYDGGTGELSLAVYRPVGPPFTAGGQWTCRAEERWIAVPIIA